MIFNPDELVFIRSAGQNNLAQTLTFMVTKVSSLLLIWVLALRTNIIRALIFFCRIHSFLKITKKTSQGLLLHMLMKIILAVLPIYGHVLSVQFSVRNLLPLFCKRNWLKTQNAKGARIRVVKRHDPVSIGPFTTTLIPVTHSIPESSSILIETDLGRVMHSGDWNLDPRPVLGEPTDAKTFQNIGAKGVLAYVGDSTNAGVDGYSGSESDVQEGLETVFKDCKNVLSSPCLPPMSVA